MDPQHGATDFESGRVSRLYQKLADQVEQLPPARRQELDQQLLPFGAIAMQPKPKQGAPVYDAAALFYKAVAALGKLQNAVDSIGSKVGKQNQYYRDAHRLIDEIDKRLQQWEADFPHEPLQHGAGRDAQIHIGSGNRPPRSSPKPPADADTIPF